MKVGNEIQTQVNFTQNTSSMRASQIHSPVPISHNNLRENIINKTNKIESFIKFAYKGFDNSSVFSKAKNVDTTKSAEFTQNMTSKVFI